ncbi:formyltetrahydrofolate deformylase [Colwellia chukchiensis]|uniref:Formyltetrahydrofolate deformylase n=1 Tax=Colwellia chukchiensis TaxID=641665 RepID=A0A1H7QNP1_9GAMM|nr:formyltetrahydrofolate deformylase [Colwellia chukchiensis]SEL49621.1 formyltetrahydrofolate deformylase [Colwellia chukchiensis]
MKTTHHYILTWQCPDTSGVLAKVSQTLYQHGAFITETCQYSDADTARFFSRIAFDDRDLNVSFAEFSDAIASLAQPLNMQYQLRERDNFPNVVIAVSKYDHCLVSLLTKWKAGVLPVNIVAITSNHLDCQPLAQWHNIPFHHLPVTQHNKAEQEQALWALYQEYQGDLLVLARYMQILSDQLCQQLRGQAINIHHSFLPSFKGAKPYHQAHQRGVKVIGATAHYVTPDLDEGPIIVQEVKPINHTYNVQDMIHLGHDLEATALCHAVKVHAEQRVCLNNSKTVILM